MARPRTIVAMNKKHFTAAERAEREQSEAAHKVSREQLKAWEHLTERARAEFERIVSLAHWLDNLDLNDLLLYCFYWDRAQEIMEHYTDAPEVLELEDKEGMPKLISNPLRRALREYSAEMRAISLKLGLASIDRLKLMTPASDKPENKFLKYLK